MRLNRHLPARLLVCAALAGSAALGAVAIPSVASATTPETVSCTTLSGSATSLAFSGCTGTGANATNAGKAPAKGTLTVSTKTLKWSTNKTSTLTFAYAKDKTSKCPKITGDTSLGEYTATGTVKGGTAAQMVGGKSSGSACVYSKKVGTKTTTVIKNLGAFKI
jgi:hypothetical protein